MNAWRRACSRLVVPPDPFRSDPRLDRLVEDLCRRTRQGHWVLNLGSGTTGCAPRTVNLDLRPFKGVHLCGDGHRLPFREEAFSGVLLRGVLEHVRAPDVVRREVSRVLEPRGFVYVEVPFLQPFHLSPEDHRRFTLPGLRFFLGEFEEVESGVQIGPGSTLAWVLREAMAALLSFGSERRYRRALTLVGWGTFWLKCLDRVVARAPFVANSASAVYFLGRKQG